MNLPGRTYLSEEYVPEADERVLWYRKIASAATVGAVEDIYNDLAGKRPDMPQEAQNLFEKARIKAFANEHHIKTVSVVAGKLVVEPIDIPRDKMVPVRRAGGRYLSDKRKLQLPLKYFRLTERTTSSARGEVPARNARRGVAFRARRKRRGETARQVCRSIDSLYRQVGSASRALPWRPRLCHSVKVALDVIDEGRKPHDAGHGAALRASRPGLYTIMVTVSSA